jgi:hypothetical protein
LQRGKTGEQPQIATMEVRHQVTAPENVDTKQVETGSGGVRRLAPMTIISAEFRCPLDRGQTR